MTGGVGTLALAAAETGATSTAEAVTFWVLAPIAVLAALGLLFVRKAVHSALLMALAMICLAILYVAQSAPFLGVVQVVVYTGAVMMLFLFVLMLVGVDSSDSLVETIRGQRLAAALAVVGFLGLLAAGVGRSVTLANRGLTEANAEGNVAGLAALIFDKYLFPFELTSALLITAALGAMVLTHREQDQARPSQRELAEARFRPGGNPLMNPAPGVYARHNAVDVPGLLPDGTPSELTLPRPMAQRGIARVSHHLGEVDTVQGVDTDIRSRAHLDGDEVDKGAAGIDVVQTRTATTTDGAYQDGADGGSLDRGSHDRHSHDTGSQDRDSR